MQVRDVVLAEKKTKQPMFFTVKWRCSLANLPRRPDHDATPPAPRTPAKRWECNSRVRCRKGYDDWNEKDVCLLLEELALGTVGHLFGTIYTVEKNLASAMARSRKMKMIPFRW